MTLPPFFAPPPFTPPFPPPLQPYTTSASDDSFRHFFTSASHCRNNGGGTTTSVARDGTDPFSRSSGMAARADFCASHASLTASLIVISPRLIFSSTLSMYSSYAARPLASASFRSASFGLHCFAHRPAASVSLSSFTPRLAWRSCAINAKTSIVFPSPISSHTIPPRDIGGSSKRSSPARGKYQ